MKKVIFVVFILLTGFWSCSQSDDNNNVPDDYVNVVIGTESGEIGNESSRPKSIIEPGGTTSWNIKDTVCVVDVDGVIQKFVYADETPKTSAKFTGKLRSRQGSRLYRAYHVPEKSKVTLRDAHILTIERENLDITESGIMYNSVLFGSYCPMVGIPVEFDADNINGTKPFQFYHLTTMIEGRVSLREDKDIEFLDKLFDKVTFEVQATNSTPFYTKIEVDLNKLNADSKVENLNECFLNLNELSGKTNYMYTTMNMRERTIRELMKEYESLGSFPIPIFALPTADSFEYTATITFYSGNTLQLKMQGSAEASRLNPVGLNVLNFDHDKIIR